MNKISKYLTYYFIKAIIGFNLGVAFIILLVDFTENIRKYSDLGKVGLVEIFGITMLKLPGLLIETSPFIILFASLLCMRSMMIRRELDIFKACGLSIWHILKPFLVVAFLYGLVLVVIVSPISAMSLRYLEAVENSFKDQNNIIQVNSVNLWMIIRGANNEEYYILSRAVANNSNQKEDVSINLQLPIAIGVKDSTVFSMLSAESGSLFQNKLFFNNVLLKDNNSFLPQELKILEVDIKGFSKDIVSLTVDSLKILIWQFPSVIKEMQRVNLVATGHVVYFYGLITMPLLFLAMVFISTRFALYDVRRGKNLYVVFITILVGVMLYFVINFLGTLGMSGFINPIFVVIIGKIIILLFSVALLFKKEGL